MANSQTSQTSTIQLDASRITRWLMILVVAFALVAIVMAFPDIDPSDGLIGQALDSLHRLFDPGIEANLTTWFSTGLLLGAALLTGLVANAKADAHDPMRNYWIALSGVVLFMSIDEAAQFHEMLNEPTRQLLGASVDAWWVWTLPALVFVSVFVLVSLRLLAAQSRRTRKLMILAFALFIFGAVVMEVVGGGVIGAENRLEVEIAAAIEEFFEMSGVVVYIYAMLGLLATMQVQVSVQEEES